MIFLKHKLSNLLELVPLTRRRKKRLQNDYSSAHYARNVTNYLDQAYLRRWIGCFGPILWPPRSPDSDVQELNDSGSARQITRYFLKRCQAYIRSGGTQFEDLF